MLDVEQTCSARPTLSQIASWCFFSPGYRSIEVLSGDTRRSGGAEAQVAYLAAAVAEMGHNVALIYGDGQAQGQRHVLAGVTAIDVAPSWRRPASLRAFWQTMEHLAPDVFYARLPGDFLWMIGLFARRRRPARFVYALAHDDHCNCWTAYDYKWWFHGPVYALGLESADVIATQHGDQGARVSRRLQSRIVGIPNLVRSFNVAPRSHEAATFDGIWISQIRPEKQLGHFLDLAASLPELQFAVVGGFDPTMSERGGELLRRRLLKLENLVYFGAQRADTIRSLLAKSRVLVNTSWGEGLPNTMLEAWSVGVPVLSLSVDPGGIIAREGIGLVSGNIPGLRRDLPQLAQETSLNYRLGRRGLSYVRKHHSLEAVCEAFMKALPGIRLAPGSAPMPGQ